MPMETAKLLDSIVEFFGDKYDAMELLKLDIATLKGLIAGRAENIKESQEKMNEGKMTTHSNNTLQNLFGAK